MTTPIPKAAPVQGPCPCWTGPVSLHDGHCCFRPANFDRDAGRCTCGHDEAGEAGARAMREGVMPTAPTVTAWLEDQLADPPAPAHVLQLMELLAAHDLELAEVQLVVNWDRHWDTREPGRWKIGKRHGGEYLWLIQFPA